MDRRLEAIENQTQDDGDVAYGEVRFRVGELEFYRHSLPPKPPDTPEPDDFPREHCMKCGKPLGYVDDTGYWREERGVRLYNEQSGDRFPRGNYVVCTECVLGALGLSSAFDACEYPDPGRRSRD